MYLATPIPLSFMKKWNLCVLAIGMAWGLSAQQRDAQLDYVARYLHLAIQERLRSGVPVSIKLGQAILESRWGTTDLAVIANNHFGIKCGTTWSGPTYYKEDDDYDAKGRLIPSCFRQFSSPEICFRAHSDFLRDTLKADRYGFLFSLNPLDYKAWAQGLRSAGYATDRSYDVKLIQIIESLELYRYDQPDLLASASSDTGYSFFRRPGETGELIPLAMCWIRTINLKRGGKIPLPVSPAGTLLLTYRITTDHPARVIAGRNQSAGADRNLKKAGTGAIIWHKVRPNELMADISETYHIRMESLYRRNRLSPNTEVAAGAFVKLQGSRVKTAPSLRPDIPEKAAPTPIQTLPAVPGAEAFDPFYPIRREQPFVPSPATKANLPSTVYSAPGGPRMPERTESVQGENVPDASTRYHVVKAGETLWSIAKKYQLTVEVLRKMNRLYDDVIVPGIALRVR